MTEENTEPSGDNPTTGQTKKDWRRDNLATRIDLRMPNEVYDRVVELATASGEKINPKTNQVRVTSTLNKLIEIGIRYFPDNNQIATGQSSDTIGTDDKDRGLSDKHNELSDRISVSTGYLSDKTGLEEKYRELSDKYQVLEDKYQKLSDELSDNNRTVQDKYQELSDNLLGLMPIDIITKSELSSFQQPIYDRLEELETYIQNQIEAVRDELKKL
jgi:hypothetical protein